MARSKYEIKAQRELEAEGWTVDYKARPFRCPRGYRIDFFGCFDLIACKAGVPFIRWISIKGHAYVPAAHRKELTELPLPPGNQKEIWVYKLDGTIKREIVMCKEC